jgi:hypothetical protein
MKIGSPQVAWGLGGATLSTMSLCRIQVEICAPAAT